MAEEKKLSLKERLAKKKGLSGGGVKKPITKEDFEQKKLEQQKLEEQLKKQEELKKQEAERRLQEEEKEARDEAARVKREAEVKRMNEEHKMKMKEKEAMLKAISGETDAGDAPKSKAGIVVLLGSVLITFLVAYTMRGIFDNRRILNEHVKQAKKAHEIFKKSNKIFDDYDRYLRNHGGDKIDFGAGKYLGKLGIPLLKDDEVMEIFPLTAGALGAAGKDMIKYTSLMITVIRQSARLNGFLTKKTIKILQEVNKQKKVIELNKESLVTVLNTDYPLPDNKDYILKMGELVDFIEVYEPPVPVEDPKAKKKKKRRTRPVQKSPLDDKLKVRLLRDTNIEFIVPKIYLVPITDAYKYFGTIKPEYIQYTEMYEVIKKNWKELDTIRKKLKTTLQEKAKEEEFFTL